MLKKFKLLVASILIVLLTGTSVFASGQEVISMGKNLDSNQRQQMMAIFSASDQAEIIEVSNEEEVRYLGKYVDRKVLGSRAISSSYVKTLAANSGIKVETYNITWVTEDMLISALTTAGVKDAYVKVAAPFPVSGTAALTGVIKGFEGATGEHIGEFEKQVASEEIATTGQLGESIGAEEASSIINRVKEEVVKDNIKDPEKIKELIEEASKDINIELTEEQKEKVTELMEKISNLDLNVEDIKNQMKNISQKLKDLNVKAEEVKSILGKILDFIRQIFEKISSLFS